MKSLNEVSKIVGISPKAMRGYVDEGLIVPTATLDNGYKLYDDDAIRRVILIKVFQDGGYTRKETKAIFESDEATLCSEYDKLMNNLREKQRLIDGQIRTVRLLQIEARLSDKAREALDSINPVDTYKDHNFKSCLDGLTNRLADLAGEIDSLDLNAYLLFWYSVVVVGIEINHEAEKRRIADAVSEAFKNFCLLMEHLDGFEGTFTDIDCSKKAQLFDSFVTSYFLDKALTAEIESICGEGMASRIAADVSSWANNEDAGKEVNDHE